MTEKTATKFPVDCTVRVTLASAAAAIVADAKSGTPFQRAGCLVVQAPPDKPVTVLVAFPGQVAVELEEVERLIAQLTSALALGRAVRQQLPPHPCNPCTRSNCCGCSALTPATTAKESIE